MIILEPTTWTVKWRRVFIILFPITVPLYSILLIVYFAALIALLAIVAPIMGLLWLKENMWNS